MRRRGFLKLSMLAGLAGQAPRLAFANAPHPEQVFFDERFTDARAIAAQLAPGALPVPVQSDVTALWTGRLCELSSQRPLALQGVTTESFHFCLERLLRSRARVESNIQRVSRDLHAWSIRTAPVRRVADL